MICMRHQFGIEHDLSFPYVGFTQEKRAAIDRAVLIRSSMDIRVMRANAASFDRIMQALF